MTPEEINRIVLWNFPLGTVARIRVRVHWSLLLFGAYILWIFRGDAQLGLIALLTLWGSVFLHELGHCFAARQQGGRADRMVLWILGGLAECEYEQRPWPSFVVAIWGPLVNLILAGLALGPLLYQVGFGSWILPWGPLPAISSLGVAALILFFKINLFMAGFNLIPAFPLDGGRVFHAALWTRQGYARAMETTIVLAYVCAALIAVYAATAGEYFLFGAALFVAAGAHSQGRALRSGALGLGASEPSWERSADAYERAKQAPEEPKRPGAIARWRDERAREREEAASARRLAMRQRLDEVLGKVSQVGLQGLSDEERRFLEEASAELRKEQE